MNRRPLSLFVALALVWTAGELAVRACYTRASAAKSLTLPENMVLILPGGKRFHQPECKFLPGKSATFIEQSKATLQGYTRCPVCGG